MHIYVVYIASHVVMLVKLGVICLNCAVHLQDKDTPSIEGIVSWLGRQPVMS